MVHPSVPGDCRSAFHSGKRERAFFLLSCVHPSFLVLRIKFVLQHDFRPKDVLMHSHTQPTYFCNIRHRLAMLSCFENLTFTVIFLGEYRIHVDDF